MIKFISDKDFSLIKEEMKKEIRREMKWNRDRKSVKKIQELNNNLYQCNLDNNDLKYNLERKTEKIKHLELNKK